MPWPVERLPLQLRHFDGHATRCRRRGARTVGGSGYLGSGTPLGSVEHRRYEVLVVRQGCHRWATQRSRGACGGRSAEHHDHRWSQRRDQRRDADVLVFLEQARIKLRVLSRHRRIRVLFRCRPTHQLGAHGGLPYLPGARPRRLRSHRSQSGAALVHGRSDATHYADHDRTQRRANGRQADVVLVRRHWRGRRLSLPTRRRDMAGVFISQDPERTLGRRSHLPGGRSRRGR